MLEKRPQATLNLSISSFKKLKKYRYIKFTVLHIQFSGIKYILIVGQPAPLAISRTYILIATKIRKNLIAE